MSVTYLTLDKKGRTTLPEEVREGLGVEPGDFILLDKTDRGTYELVPAALVPKEDRWHFHPEFRARLAAGRVEIEDRRFTETRTPKEAQAFLDSLKKRARRRG